MKTFISFIAEQDSVEDLRNRALKLKVVQVGQEHHLDKLVDDPNPQIRLAILRRGFQKHVDRYVNDPDQMVRGEVARMGTKKHLDRLVDDPSSHVRFHVAHHGHHEHLDKLVNDPDWEVRNAAIRSSARHKYYEPLDKLVHDPSYAIRYQVADVGNQKHLNQLFHNLMNSQSSSGNYDILQRVVARTKNLEHLSKIIDMHTQYPNLAFRAAGRAYKMDNSIGDSLADHPLQKVRGFVASKEKKEHLDKLVNDKSAYVRAKVASAGHSEHLDKLINDKSPSVRKIALARLGKLMR